MQFGQSVKLKTSKRVQYSTTDQVASCAIPSPPEWPPLLQVPAPEYRATQTDYTEFPYLPNESCRKTGTCPIATLLTGSNQSFGLSLAGNLFPTSSLSLSDVLGGLTNNSLGILGILANNVLGSSSVPGKQNFLDSAYTSDMPIYFLRPQCTSTSPFSVPIQIESLKLQQAYDLLNSNMNGFNVTIWYNSTYKNNTGASAMGLVRVPRSVNLVFNAYLELLLGFGTKMLFNFVKEMPKPKTQLRFDISSLLSAQFFTYVIMALFLAVEESLKSINLYHGGIGDRLAGKYSGGMKRRLSVAISLIGDLKVVYMDEPSTGLDPASRNNLWNVVKCAKQDRAIILTTHSMEEAEVLCDRIGIFVDGGLQCIGNPKEETSDRSDTNLIKDWAFIVPPYTISL